MAMGRGGIMRIMKMLMLRVTMMIRMLKVDGGGCCDVYRHRCLIIEMVRVMLDIDACPTQDTYAQQAASGLGSASS